MYRLSLSFLLASALAWAQVPIAATLVGRVMDATGAVVPGASIQVRSSTTNSIREVLTDSAGNYTFSSLPPGVYRVTAHKEGFAPVTATGLELQVEQRARVDLTLQIGTTQTAIEVTAPIPVLNTENATKSDVISHREITEIPLASMDQYDLALTVPGVAAYKDTSGRDVSGTGWSSNGARPTSNSILIGGVDVTSFASSGRATSVGLDAIQEFRVMTNSFSAEYGRRGGSVLTMAVTQGGNQVHGGAYENFRNNKLNARNFFAPARGVIRWNLFGGSIGGPVVVPGIYNGRDRTFFFFNLESNRQVTDNTTLNIVPTALERRGDFSQTRTAAGAAVYLRDPLVGGSCNAASQGGCFPGNIIPASRISPVARKLLDYYPLPNAAGANNYVVMKPWHQFATPMTIRVDQRLSSRDWLSAMAVGMWIEQHDPFAFGSGSNLGSFPSNYRGFGPVLSLTWTSTITPALLNQAQAGLMRNNGKMTQEDSDQNYAAALGMAGVDMPPFTYGFPRFLVTGMASIGDSVGAPNHTNENNYTFSDTLTWVKSGHTMKVGFQGYRNQYASPYTALIRGQYGALGNWTSVPLADFALGYLGYATKLKEVATSYFTQSSYSVFAQDDWKVSTTLTLNLGLRYERPLAPAAQDGRLGSFIPGLAKIAIGSDITVPNLAETLAAANLTGKVVLAGDAGLPQTLVYTPAREFAPRLGLAWRPLTRTVLRTGGGIFYTNDAFGPIRAATAAIYPFVKLQQFNQGASPTALTLENPVPTAVALVANAATAAGVETRQPASYLAAWNVTAEQEIGRGTLLSLSYAGSKGTHLGRMYNINQRRPTTQTYPYAGFGVINYFAFNSSSTYNSGSATLLRRFSGNVFVRASYIYSKCIDYQSQINGAGAGNYSGAQDASNLAAERGRCDWDIGHSVLFNFIYATPREFGRFGRGWQLAGTGRTNTGRPFTPQLARNQSVLGQPTRPDRVAKGTVPNRTTQRWFDTSAFVPLPSTAGRFGNSGRNILDGPGFASFDLSLSKWFRFWERHALQVRFEAYNFLNHANFSQPSVNVDAGGTGTLTQAFPPRSLQIALRYRF